MTLSALRDLGPRPGSTKPHALECDDGRIYLVKFNDGTRTVINEYVGYALAVRLGLPVARSATVTLSSGLIDGSRDLKSREIIPGVHFGSELLEGGVHLGAGRESPIPTNSACFPGVIVFDNLVLNRDRANHGNNLLLTTRTGEVEYYMVDFNEILAGPRWTVESMEAVRENLDPVPCLSMLRLSVRGMSSFSPWLESVESISPEALSQVLSDVPSSWQIGEREKGAISDFVLARKRLMREILASDKGKFPNWR